jgi:hypothetical protein
MRCSSGESSRLLTVTGRLASQPGDLMGSKGQLLEDWPLPP